VRFGKAFGLVAFALVLDALGFAYYWLAASICESECGGEQTTRDTLAVVFFVLLFALVLMALLDIKRSGTERDDNQV
jgi:uncharacterized PurR-regulated membrane protein YhhQ (DUF165 family)